MPVSVDSRQRFSLRVLSLHWMIWCIPLSNSFSGFNSASCLELLWNRRGWPGRHLERLVIVSVHHGESASVRQGTFDCFRDRYEISWTWKWDHGSHLQRTWSAPPQMPKLADRLCKADTWRSWTICTPSHRRVDSTHAVWFASGRHQ